MTSPWRLYSRKVIESAIASVPDGDIAKIKKSIDEAYPFGRRENHPYKMWLIERRQTLIDLGFVPKPETKPKTKNGGNQDLVPPGQISLFDFE